MLDAACLSRACICDKKQLDLTFTGKFVQTGLLSQQPKQIRKRSATEECHTPVPYKRLAPTVWCKPTTCPSAMTALEQKTTPPLSVSRFGTFGLPRALSRLGQGDFTDAGPLSGQGLQGGIGESNAQVRHNQMELPGPLLRGLRTAGEDEQAIRPLHSRRHEIMGVLGKLRYDGDEWERPCPARCFLFFQKTYHLLYVQNQT